MKYYKLLDENKNLIRLDSAEANVSNGIEITEKEYCSLLPKSEEIAEDTITPTSIAIGEILE